MFNKGIYETSLTGEAANRLFSHITDFNTPDKSFLATLRALLRKRLVPEKSVHICCNKIQQSAQEITNMSISECMRMFHPYETMSPLSKDHTILVVHTSTLETYEKMAEIVLSNVGQGKRYMSNYLLREDLRVFYARKLTALFYTDVSQRNAVIFTNTLEIRHFHALQMMIPKYLPTLFASEPLTEIETNLLKSTGNKSAVEYESLILEFTKGLDIRAETIRIKLAGFEATAERMMINDITRELTTHRGDYERQLAVLRSIIEKIQKSKYTLAGLECAVNNQNKSSELIDYFICNKNLSLIHVRGAQIEFVVHGYADIYDEDAFRKYVENLEGFMYNGICSSVTKKQAQMLYQSIFGKEQYRLRICAAFTASMKDGIKPFMQYTFPPECQTYIPNPHIHHHGCIGTYAIRFHEYMNKKDYVGAIEQAIVSARNLNFFDSAVMQTFARELTNFTAKCLEKSDGTLLTPLEAIKELEVESLCQDQ